MIPPKTKAVGYIRVSTTEQIGGESLDTQRNQIKQFAEVKGWDLTHIYADEGATGTKLEYRTDFQQMIQDAKDGKFSVIVFWKLSRFARNAREYMQLSHELDQNGVILASVKENIDPTTKTGKMIAGILALFAEWEHESMREQMYDNKMAVWKDHRAFIGKTAFGYFWNKESNQLEIHDQEAAIYHRIVNMYLKQGMSMKDITIQLNSEGISTAMFRKKKNGEPMKRNHLTSTVISYILKNPVYYGHYVVNQHVYKDSSRGAGSQRTKQKKPESEMITFPLPGLITKTKWDEVQKTTEFRKVKTKNRGKHTDMFFLRDICVCGLCGSKASPKLGSQLQNGFNIRYYSCYYSGSVKKALERGTRPKCTLPNLRAEKVEKQVWNQIMANFGVASQLSKGAKKSISKLYDPGQYEERILELEQNVLRLSADLKIKERARKNLYSLIEKEDLDTIELGLKLRENQDQTHTIQGHITEAENRIQELKHVCEDEKRMQSLVSGDKSFLRKLRKELKELSLPDKKLLMESWIDCKITLDYASDSGEDGPGGIIADFKTSINIHILQRFMDEGKLSRLDKNSTDYYATNVLGGVPANQPRLISVGTFMIPLNNKTVQVLTGMGGLLYIGQLHQNPKLDEK